jgi:acyl-CoA thioester hydrolase
MARLKLTIPSESIFQTQVEVQIGQINYGGHLGNDSVLTLCQEARLQFLKKYEWTEIDIEGLGLIMADSQVMYRSEAFHGDLLVISLFIDNLGEHSFDLYYQINQASSGIEVARCKSGMAFFDYKTRKISKVPDIFRDALNK